MTSYSIADIDIVSLEEISITEIGLCHWSNKIKHLVYNLEKQGMSVLRFPFFFLKISLYTCKSMYM